MMINADLAHWGEPPADPAEESLVALLATIVERRQRGEPVDVERLLHDHPDLIPAGKEMAEVVTWLQEFAASVLEHSGFLAPRPAGGGVTPPSTGEAVFPDPFPGEFLVRGLLGEG